MNKSVIVFVTNAVFNQMKCELAAAALQSLQTAINQIKNEKPQRSRKANVKKANFSTEHSHFEWCDFFDMLRFWCVVAFTFRFYARVFFSSKRSSELAAKAPTSNHLYPVFITVINKSKTKRTNRRKKHHTKRRNCAPTFAHTPPDQMMRMMRIRAIYVLFWVISSEFVHLAWPFHRCWVQKSFNCMSVCCVQN